jgi:NADH-quinone oxidoreductase subunit C
MRERYLTLIRPVCTLEPGVDETTSPKAITVAPSDILSAMDILYRHESTFFDMLSCITGIDNGAAGATMEVVYNLYSIPYNQHLTVKVILPREKPEIESMAHIWKTANWQEREIYDMFGIHFKNHPDLRRILMPADWEGHPLRKDYQQQAYYRNIKVEY